MRHVLLSLSLLIGMATLGSGNEAGAQGPLPLLSRDECLNRVTDALGFNAQSAARLAPTTPVTYELIERMTRVAYGQGPWRQDGCEFVADETTDHLYRYLRRRFDRVLTRADADTFYSEYQIAAPFHQSGRAITRLAGALPSDFSSRYLGLIRSRLFNTLASSRWADYSMIPFSFDEWSEEWRMALGGRATAGSDSERQTVALDPFSLPPEEMEYFLFHELAHLDDWAADRRTRTTSNVIENERNAWDETARFIDWRSGRGTTIPRSIVAIRSTIQTVGTEAWASAAVRSRRLR